MKRGRVTMNEEKLLLGLDFLVDGVEIEVEDEDRCKLSDSELVYRAVRNTVNQIWIKYSFMGSESGLLTTEEIKNFLKDFLKGQQYDETDLDFVILNMNTDKEG